MMTMATVLIMMTIIIIIIIIIIISFMQGIYTYIPDTNYVPREYSVAAILLLLFMVLISLVPVLNLLYFYISTFRSMCAVPNMAVFWSSLTSCFPGMLLKFIIIIIIIIKCDGTVDVLGIEDYRILWFRVYMILLSTCKIMLNL